MPGPIRSNTLCPDIEPAMKRHAIFLAMLAFSQPLAAADLLQTYREARANDPVYASARAARDAGRENLPQGLAQLLPNVSASGFTQMNYVDISFRNLLPQIGRASWRETPHS